MRLSSTLFDYEWQFLLQMATRLNYCATYNEMCTTFLQQTRTLIPFQTGIIFKAGREDGHVTLSSPVSTEARGDGSEHAFFIDGRYPHWEEFIMSPYSSVFRQSDIIPPSKWEKTRVYSDIWQPKGIFWGLFISLVHKDIPLVIIGIFREKNDEDFNARDIYIMNTLRDPLERKFCSLLGQCKTAKPDGLHEKISQAAAGYKLTRRETEIVTLVCGGKSSEEMCRNLYITHATLSKHLSNIYAKTRARNRTQLFALFYGDS